MLSIIKTIFSFEAVDSPHQGSEAHDIQLAATALLLEIGYADFEIHSQELVIIADALKEHFELTDAEVNVILEVALEEHEQGSSTHPFVRKINQHFAREQKRRIIEWMWRVAYADRRLDKYEEHRIRQIADLLYLPHQDFIRTKLAVQKEHGIGSNGE